MAHQSEWAQLAAELLGVDPCAVDTEIRYGYYRMMQLHHPDKNPGGQKATSVAALINEAKNVLLGKEANPVLLKDAALVAEVMQRPVAQEEVLSYAEWLKQRFYDMEQCSIWPC